MAIMLKDLKELALKIHVVFVLAEWWRHSCGAASAIQRIYYKYSLLTVK